MSIHRYQTQDIQHALMAYLREIGLETPLLEHRIKQAWPVVAGDVVAKYTKEVYIKNSMLHVVMSSAPLRANLQMGHKELARRLNEHVGAQIITDVRFL